MKRIFFALFFFISAFFLLDAQAQSQHLTFKGIEINGTLTEFISKLQKQGFTLIDRFESGAALKGTFAGEDAVVLIPCKENEIVWKVVVDFNEKNTWYSLKSAYKSYKESLTSKYGKGESYEYFKSPYYDGDGYEMSAVKLEKCFYSTIFEIKEGDIIVEICKGANVRISYEDNENYLKIKEKREQQKYDDL